MKRILSIALALFCATSFGATLNPVQLLNPAGSTAGQVVRSSGPSTPPAWGSIATGDLPVLPITKGGTGATTASAALTALGGVTAAQTTGRLLNVQVFTSSGTYTPTAGATKAIVEVMAPGGGSGGNPVTSGTQTSVAGAGNAGAYGKIWIASGLTSQTVTIGAVGAAGAAGSAGGAGGTTSFGSLISCLGGAGGAAGVATAVSSSITTYATNTAATCSGTGTFLVSGTGASATKGFFSGTTPALELPGDGGSTQWGQGGQGRTITPQPGTGYGAGAGAAYLGTSGAAAAGAVGAPGLVIIQEFN